MSLRNVRKFHGGKPVLDGLDFEVEEGSKVGIFGKSPSGTSALLECVAGIGADDSGDVERRRDTTCVYLPPRMDGDTRTALETVRASRSDLQALEDELRRCAKLVGSPEEADMDLIHRALETQEDLLRRFREADGPAFEGEARSLLSELAGLDRKAMSRPTREMSGGKRKLVALVSCFIRRPDILVLDEPETNLEPERCERLERFINRFDGAVVVASRDRSFLDRVSEHVFEVRDGKVVSREGGYGRKEDVSNVVDLAK